METQEQKFTQMMTESLAHDWSNIAGSVIDITIIGNEIIATGSELGCYKLAYALRDLDIEVRQEKTQSYWYLVRKCEGSEELKFVERLRQKLDSALNNGFNIEIPHKIELEKQLQACLDIVSEF